MAVFNPGVQPGSIPDYTGVSKPISAPTPDTSTGQYLKETGEAFTGAVKLGDDFVKEGIKKDITENVDATRDAYTQYLVNANSGVNTDTNGNVVVPPATATTPTPDNAPQSLLPSNAPGAPAGIQNGLDRYGRITEAQKQNSGTKANDTAYTAQLTSIAKNLRAQWPGYRDYIDEQVSSISGIPIANAYVKNLLQDLNAAQTNAKEGTKRIEAGLMSQVTDKVPGAAAAYMNYQKTGDTATALNFIETSKSVAQQATEATSALALEKARGDNIQTRAKANLDLIFGNDMNLAWKGVAQGAGIKSPDDWATVIDNAGSGNIMPNSIEQRNAALALQGQRAQIEAQWRLKANKPMDVQNPDGSTSKTTYSSIVGAEGVNNMIKEKLKTFDTYIEAATNDKTGTAVYAAQHTAAYLADKENGIVTNPSNEAMATTAILNKQLGPQFTSSVLGEALAKNMDGIVRNLYTDKTKDMLLQPRLKTNGVPSTLKQDLEDATKPNATKNGPIKSETKYFDNLIGNVNLLARTDTPLEAKENIARYFFDPTNRGTLVKFNMDSQDQNGNTVGGRETIFKMLTSKKVTDGIAEVSKINPQIGINYKNYVETEWGTAILGPKLNEIKDITEGANNQISGVKGGVHMAFNDGKGDGTPGFFLIDGDGKPLDRAGKTPVEVNYFNHAKEVLSKVNEGIGNINEVAKKFKGNTSISMITALQNAGVDIPNSRIGQAVLKSAPNKALDDLETETGINVRRKATMPETN